MLILARIRLLTVVIELTMSDRSSDSLVIELITRHNPLVKLTDWPVRLGNQVTHNQSWNWLSHRWIGSGQRNRRHNFRPTRQTPSSRSYLDYKIHLKSLKQVRIQPFKSKPTHLTKKRFQGVFCDSLGQVSDEKLVLLQPRRILKSVTFVRIALGHEHGPAFNAGAVTPERSLRGRLRRELHVREPFGSATKVVHETHLLHFTDLTERWIRVKLVGNDKGFLILCALFAAYVMWDYTPINAQIKNKRKNLLVVIENTQFMHNTSHLDIRWSELTYQEHKAK